MSRNLEDGLNVLRQLPPLEPPASAETATLAAMARASRPRWRTPIALAAALVAAIGLTGVVTLGSLNGEPPEESQPAAVDDAGFEEIYASYLAAAAQLEALMGQLPEPRRVMRGGTALTIIGLEDRIALLDSELNRPETVERPVEYRTALARDRVEAMNALVQVRYAQSTAFVF